MTWLRLTPAYKRDVQALAYIVQLAALTALFTTLLLLLQLAPQVTLVARQR